MPLELAIEITAGLVVKSKATLGLHGHLGSIRAIPRRWTRVQEPGLKLNEMDFW
jgi:hypothetical protein